MTTEQSKTPRMDAAYKPGAGVAAVYNEGCALEKELARLARVSMELADEKQSVIKQLAEAQRQTRLANDRYDRAIVARDQAEAERIEAVRRYGAAENGEPLSVAALYQADRLDEFTKSALTGFCMATGPESMDADAVAEYAVQFARATLAELRKGGAA
jgi:hypothetical protein